MGKAIVTIKIMPVSPDTDLAKLEENTQTIVQKFANNTDTKFEQKPVAFGLKSLNVTFIMDESLGSPETLEKELDSLEEVNSVETIDVRRAVG